MVRIIRAKLLSDLYFYCLSTYNIPKLGGVRKIVSCYILLMERYPEETRVIRGLKSLDKYAALNFDFEIYSF